MGSPPWTHMTSITPSLAGFIRVLPLLVSLLSPLAAQTPTPPRPILPPFRAQILSSQYFSEGAAIGDLDKDGKPDLLSGPYWWKGPGLTQRFKIYPPKAFAKNAYADNFASYLWDLNGDGFLDLVLIGFPGAPISWFENPGRPGPLWKKHALWPSGGMETALLTDLEGDGKPELLCSTLGFLLILRPVPGKAKQPWAFTLVSPLQVFSNFSHGLGVGDLNGDGRKDILVAKAWFEQPKSPSGTWTPHLANFGSGIGGARMFSFDVDGDGDADVVSSINAHGYGLSWFEQYPLAGKRRFREHVIQKARRDPSDPDQFSQLHGLQVADMDGDGLLDLITGKTYWAHLGRDPGAKDPALLYWFRLERKGGLRFVPKRIHANSGVGRMFQVGDLDGDGRPDLAIGNKKGVFVFFQE